MAIAAIRFNNPGDVSLPIRGWAGPGEIVGLWHQPGYAKFPTMEVGYQAFLQRLRSYIEEGYTSILRMGKVYAEDPHWPFMVARIGHLNPYAPLDPTNEAQMHALAGAIIKQETGKTYAELGLGESAA